MANETEKMIAYCGIVCTGCEAYIATQTGDEKKARETAEMWSKAYNANIKLEDVWCNGCLVEGKKCAHCHECEIRKCAREKGFVNCAHCPDYKCETLKGFLKMVPDAEKLLDEIRAGL